MVSSSTLALIAAAAGLLYPLQVAAACQEIQNVLITHYGTPDNSPPGPSIGTNCFGHNNVAGGTGTASDPITFASADGEFDNCELIYIPLFQKYFYKGDSCAQCQTDWQSGQWHADLWTGSTTNGGQTQIDCENSLPGGPQLVIRGPPTNLAVNTGPFFANNQCDTSLTFPVKSGTYCSGSSSPGSAPPSYTTSSAASPAKSPAKSPSSPSPSGKPTPVANPGGHQRCSWVGHCIGAPCQNYNDCSDQYVCSNGQCASSL